jgi:hypothetical protein
MRPSTHVVLVMLALMTGAVNAAAQAPPPPAGAPGAAPPPAAPPAAPAPPAPPAAAPAPAPAAPPAPAPPEAAPAAPAAAPPAGGAPAPAPAGPANWYDKFAADAFVDAYGSFNSNMPKPMAPASLYAGVPPGPASAGATYGNPPGGNSFRAFDVAQGFAVNWAGLNVAYTADQIGGTVGLRFGPGAIIYHNGTSDEVAGLQFVKQAYATWKPVDKLTLDLGKWDQPYGSEVADSQLNMNYTRSVLFWYIQPLWFTGLRVDYAASDMLDLKVFAANGWNNTLGINRSKTFGVQAVLTPVKEAVFYVGYVGGPQQADVGAGTPAAGGTPAVPPGDVPDANSHWRHLIDFVADINPTSALRFLLNADFRAEDGLPPPPGGMGTHSASVYGANLVIKYAFTDAFSGALRGEYYHDEHGDTLLTNTKTDVEDGTLSLNYTVGSHLAFMLDGRYDHASTPDIPNAPGIFQKNFSGFTDSQFTATLGVIASTK